MYMENVIKPDELKSFLEKRDDILLLDVRRKPDYQAEPFLIPGAEWRDPEEVAAWSETIPKARQVVIYCVKGGSVSKSVSDYLRNKQIGTSYLDGGFKAWKESGGNVMSVSDPDSRENFRNPFSKTERVHKKNPV
jgi:rhodanese-related sulfurtransferase